MESCWKDTGVIKKGAPTGQMRQSEQPKNCWEKLTDVQSI